MTTPLIYLLLDANLLAGYYAPETFNKTSKPAGERIQCIVDSVRNGGSPWLRLLAPEVCVAEAQTVLSKHANPKWKGTTAKGEDPQAIHGKKYKRIAEAMFNDLHGGRLIESIPLQRYHVLAKHLITPIDHRLHFPKPDGGRTNEMGGTDQLVCGMAVWLSRFLGPDRLLVLTADYRMYKVLDKARRMSGSKIEAWGVEEVAETKIGFKWVPGLFPKAIHLPNAKEGELRKALGAWPLPTRVRKASASDRPPNRRQVTKLLDLYKNMGIGRDRLPYTPDMTKLVAQFSAAVGRSFTEAQVWSALVDRLKHGDGKVKK
ncbi:MAG TPA: hypothetical protein VF777_00900 [Phycisphaerales bacterium]